MLNFICDQYQNISNQVYRNSFNYTVETTCVTKEFPVHIHLSKFADISKTAVAKLEVVDISRKVVLYAERGKLTVHEYRREPGELRLKFVCVLSSQITWKYSHCIVYCHMVPEKDISVLFSEPPPISSKSFVYKLYNAQQKPVMEVRNISYEFQMYRIMLVFEL